MMFALSLKCRWKDSTKCSTTSSRQSSSRLAAAFSS